MQTPAFSQWFNNDIMKALSWTFFHSLWQGLLAAIVAAIIISVTRSSSPRLRYNLLALVTMAFVAGTFISFFMEWQAATTHSISATSAESAGPGIIGAAVPILVSENLLSSIGVWINTNTSLIISAWLLVFVIHCIRLVTGFSQVHRLRASNHHPVSEEWKNKFEVLSRSLGISRGIQLLQSELVQVPVAIGFLKPVVLLPMGLITQLPASQVETILLHELGHIRRQDYLVNCIQRVMEAVLFFNPGFLWISSLLRQEREACCDEIAIADTYRRNNYIQALVSFQEFSPKPAPFAMAINRGPQHLLNRVTRMITKKNRPLGIIETGALVVGVIIFCAFTLKPALPEITSPGTKPVQLVTVAPASSVVAAIEEQNTYSIPAPVLKKQSLKTYPYKLAVIDTVPARKDSAAIAKQAELVREISIAKEKQRLDSEKALEDIIRLKEQIGAKKDAIGAQKELLKQRDGKEREKVMAEIAERRKEVELQRAELENKRAIFGALKLQEQKNKEREKIQEQKLEQKLKQLQLEQNIKNQQLQQKIQLKQQQPMLDQKLKQLQVEQNLKKQQLQQKLQLKQQQQKLEQKLKDQQLKQKLLEKKSEQVFEKKLMEQKVEAKVEKKILEQKLEKKMEQKPSVPTSRLELKDRLQLKPVTTTHKTVLISKPRAKHFQYKPIRFLKSKYLS
jgi:bla regulator protein BlaR1